MSRIFSVNFNKSLNDKYGATATLGATATVRRDEKGYALKCKNLDTDYMTYGDIASINAIGTGEFSVVIGFNSKGFLNHGSAVNSLFGKGEWTASGLAIGTGNGLGITTYIGNGSLGSGAVKLNTNNLYIVTRNSAGLCSIYVNGVLANTPVTNVQTVATTKPLSIGFDGTGTARTPNASIYLSEVYNHCLSEVEIQKLTADFLASSAPSKSKIGFIQNKATDLSSQKDRGLIASYNMIKNGTTLVDTSGNNNGMTLTGGNTNSTKEGINFPNSGYYKKTGFTGLNTGLNANQYTVSMRVKFSEATRVQVLLSFLGPISKYFDTSSKLVISGTSNTLTSNQSFDLNKWYTINILVKAPGAEIYIDGVSDNSNSTYTENITVASAFLAYSSAEAGATKLNGEIADVRIHNRILTAQECRDYHNSFIVPIISEDFSTEPADGTTSVFPQGWIGTAVVKFGEIPKLRGEQIVNGDFSSVTGWFGYTDTGMSITGGKAVFTATPTGNGVYQIPLQPGERYLVKYEITEISSGGIYIRNGGSSTYGQLRTTPGVYTQEVPYIDGNVIGVCAFGTTTAKIDNMSVVGIEPLPTITKGTKYVEGVTLGSLRLGSANNTSTFEIDFYKGATGVTSSIFFMRNASGSYLLQFNTANQIVLLKFTGVTATTICASVTNYVAITTWYRFKITRTNAGVFTVYIKGGTFGKEWVLVSTTGGTGTNPATDLTYNNFTDLAITFQVGDRLANVRELNGVVV